MRLFMMQSVPSPEISSFLPSGPALHLTTSTSWILSSDMSSHLTLSFPMQTSSILSAANDERYLEIE